jgi:ribosomal protein L23
VRRRSRGRSRVIGRSPNWKKAVVTLGPGQRIDGLFEGV